MISRPQKPGERTFDAEVREALEHFKERQQFEAATAARRGRIIWLLVTLIIFGGGYLIGREFELFKENAARNISIAAGLSALVTLVLAYLKPSQSATSRSGEDVSFTRARRYVDQALEIFAEKIKSPQPSILMSSKEERDLLIDAVRRKIETGGVDAYVEQLKASIEQNLQRRNEDSLFRTITDRMGREVQDQTKRGNLNLVLGMLTTLTGLAILGYSVVNAPITQNPNEVLVYFLPRISLVLVIEVFAYFFLRLYKQSIAEIKYFQNEITNIESRQLAIQISVRHDSQDLRMRIVEELVKTERNFLMNKDQTTVELERERLSRASFSEALASFKDWAKRDK